MLRYTKYLLLSSIKKKSLAQTRQFSYIYNFFSRIQFFFNILQTFKYLPNHWKSANIYEGSRYNLYYSVGYRIQMSQNKAISIKKKHLTWRKARWQYRFCIAVTPTPVMARKGRISVNNRNGTDRSHIGYIIAIKHYLGYNTFKNIDL